MIPGEEVARSYQQGVFQDGFERHLEKSEAKQYSERTTMRKTQVGV